MNTPAFGSTYIAGFDIGSASLGWSAISTNQDEPRGLIDLGALTFDPGVTSVKNAIERGADESKNRKRRLSRSARRRIGRRALRLNCLFRLLQQHELLPATDPPRPGDDPHDTGQARQRTIDALDNRFRDKWRSTDVTVVEGRRTKEVLADQLPYLLRKHGLYEALDFHEFGRVLMHLAQRRGFLGSRLAESLDETDSLEKGAMQDDPLTDPETTVEQCDGMRDATARRGEIGNSLEKKGVVKAGIAKLEDEMHAANAKTLGEFFSGLNPHERRIRARWTDRDMYEKEFELLWNKQAMFHDKKLTPDLREEVRHIIFSYRPVTWDRDTIGFCELEFDPEHKEKYTAQGKEELRRAPWSHPDAQSFRLVQRVNDLRIIPNFGALPQELTHEQREILKQLLESEGDKTYAQLRAALKPLNLPPKARFNFEPRSGKHVAPVKGNRTISVMLRYFEHWNSDSLPETEKALIIEKWCNTDDERELVQFAENRGLSAENAKGWSAKSPEPGRCSLCLKAIRKLLPLMKSGVCYRDAVDQVYPERKPKPLPFLPPVKKAIPELRNPAVERSLTQIRKLVNEMIRSYGVKPQRIRVELARELRKPRRLREQIWDRNNEGAERRRDAIRRIFGVLQENQVTKRKRDVERLIEKVLLWEECGGRCPYTDEELNFSSMILHGYYQVEHILPKSRFPFNYFSNKTLAHPKANAEKSNRTPWEAYHDRPKEYEDILRRVAHFKGPHAEEKLRRFRMNTEEARQFAEDFTERQLNDTAYASRLGCKYLSTLYGGDVVNGKRVVSVTSGGVTKSLRDAWKLGRALPYDRNDAEVKSADELLDAEPKNRSDHRHHAVDAVVIALTTDRQIKRLNDQAARNREVTGQESYKDLPEPWDGFLEEVKRRIKNVVVSHRPEHKLQGKLHTETNYSHPRDASGKPCTDGEYVHLRCDVRELLADIARGKKSESALNDIVDEKIRGEVKKHLGPMRSFLHAYRQWKKDQHGKKKKDFDWSTKPRQPELVVVTKRGRSIPIRRARMRERLRVRQIGSAPPRFVLLRNNHHLSVIAELDQEGHEKCWHGRVVSLLDAMHELTKTPRKLRRGKSVPQVVNKEYEFVVRLDEGGRRRGRRYILSQTDANAQAEAHRIAIVRGPKDTPLLKFKFYLMGGDIIELNGDTPDTRELWVVRAFSQEGQGRLGLVRINDARPKDEMDEKSYWRPMVNELFKRECVKVEVDLLGNVHYPKWYQLRARAGAGH